MKFNSEQLKHVIEFCNTILEAHNKGNVTASNGNSLDIELTIAGIKATKVVAEQILATSNEKLVKQNKITWNVNEVANNGATRCKECGLWKRYPYSNVRRTWRQCHCND